MTQDELRKIEELDSLVLRGDVLREIERLAARLIQELEQRPSAAFVREQLPVALFGASLASEIRSGNIYVIRPGVSSGRERHPNSHQRSMTLSGEGTFELGPATERHVIANHPAATAVQRWVSIPPNTWHQAIAHGAYWTVVTFHTTADNEIINDR